MSTLNFNLIETELEREKNYWSEKLAGDLVLTSLLSDFNRSAAGGPDRQSVALVFDDNLTRKLREVCGPGSCAPAWPHAAASAASATVPKIPIALFIWPLPIAVLLH